MRKRGARIKHRAAQPPGLVCISLDKAYETQLRASTLAFSRGYACRDHWLDLCDTHDLVAIARRLNNDTDTGTSGALEAAGIALLNVSDRFDELGKWGTTADEYAALQLLQDVSLSYWSSHSGELFRRAYCEMRNLRRAERARMQASQSQPQQVTTEGAAA